MAIRELSAPKEFLYEPTLRPAPFGGMPRGVMWEFVAAPHDLVEKRRDLPKAKNSYGVVKTERELTKQEIEHFDLRPVTKVETV